MLAHGGLQNQPSLRQLKSQYEKQLLLIQHGSASLSDVQVFQNSSTKEDLEDIFLDAADNEEHTLEKERLQLEKTQALNAQMREKLFEDLSAEQIA